MTQIFVTVNEHGEVYTSSKILGIKGEKNARQLVFDAPVYPNCSYEVWFNTGGSSVTSASVVGGACTVPASVLVNEDVSLEWVAVNGTEIMAKSKPFFMKVILGLDDDNLPIPSYEDAVTMLSQIEADYENALAALNSAVPSEGTTNSVLTKQNSSNPTEWKTLANLAKATAFGQVFVIDYYDNPTTAQIEDAISIIKSYINASFPKHLILKLHLDSATTYLTLSSLTIRSNDVYLVFVGNIHNYGQSAHMKKIHLNTFTDEYEQTSASGWSYLNAGQVAKLTLIENNAQENVIETVKVNGTALTVTNKAVDISLADYTTTAQVNNIVNTAIANITDGDGVGY